VERLLGQDMIGQKYYFIPICIKNVGQKTGYTATLKQFK